MTDGSLLSAGVLPPSFSLDIPARAGTVRRACAHCRKGKHDTALAITRKSDGSLVWFCHRCGNRGVRRADHTTMPHPQTRRPTRTKVDQADERTRHDGTMRVIQAGCREIRPGDPVADYLTSRHLPMPANDVFYHPSLRDHTGQLWPCMVAMVTDAVSNEPLTMHRTFLTTDGKKAPIDRTRSPLKGGRKKGGVIRLFADEEVTLGLGIAEGIESALSAVILGFSPVWACIDAGNMAAFPVLEGIESLTVFIDNDPPNPNTGKAAGQSAFAAVAGRWLEAGREVRHVLPPRGDINDYLVECVA